MATQTKLGMAAGAPTRVIFSSLRAHRPWNRFDRRWGWRFGKGGHFWTVSVRPCCPLKTQRRVLFAHLVVLITASGLQANSVSASISLSSYFGFCMKIGTKSDFLALFSILEARLASVCFGLCLHIFPFLLSLARVRVD